MRRGIAIATAGSCVGLGIATATAGSCVGLGIETATAGSCVGLGIATATAGSVVRRGIATATAGSVVVGVSESETKQNEINTTNYKSKQEITARTFKHPCGEPSRPLHSANWPRTRHLHALAFSALREHRHTPSAVPAVVPRMHAHDGHPVLLDSSLSEQTGGSDEVQRELVVSVPCARKSTDRVEDGVARETQEFERNNIILVEGVAVGDRRVGSEAHKVF